MAKTKKTRKFRSLAVTLTVTFFTLTAVIMTIIGGLFFYFDFITQQKLIAEQQQHTAYKAAQTVGSFIQEKFSILEKAATLSDLAAISREEQEVILEKLLGKEQSFRQLVLLDDEEEELIRVSRLSKLLSVELMDYDKSELFSKVTQGETYISPVYIDEITSEPMVVMAVAAPDIFGDFKGALLAEVNLKFMWDLVERIEIGEEGSAYVVDKRGDLIAFDDVTRVLKGENLVHLDEVKEFVEGDELTHQSAADVSKGIQNTSVVANHAHLGKPDWAVVVELPVLEAYQPVTRRVLVSGSIILLTLGLAIVAVVYLSKGLTKPIISLRNAAIEIGKGKLETKIEIRPGDEIGELASSLNQMAADLKKSRVQLEEYSKELEKKVEERTKDLKKAIEQLAEEKIFKEKESESLLETIGEAIVITDDKGAVTYINPAFERLFGFSPEELKGRIFEETVRGFDLDEKALSPESLSSIAAITAKGQKRRILLEAKDGQRVAVIVGAAPIYVEKEFKGVIRVLHDFSEDLALQRQKDEFFSIASHELRTPLTVISGNLDIFLEDYTKTANISAKDRQLLEDTEKATDRLIKMINDFLNVSRLDQGRFKVEPKTLDGCQAVAKTIKELMPLAKEKKLKLTYQCQPGKIMVRADEGLLHETLINLISNAIKFTEKGEVAVDASESLKDGRLIIKITDTGIGIAEENQKFLFKRFQQAMTRTLAREVGGTGLGLYISREFARLMGGDVVLVKSELGKGSVFKLDLPLATKEKLVKKTKTKEKKKLTLEKA